MTPIVSVIIPAYDRREGVLRALDAIAAQTLDRTQIEVIVVDNASTDGTSDAVRSWPASLTVRLLRIEKNRGPAQARNLGLEEAQGEFVAFTDSDCIPSPRWLEEGLTAFGPGVGVVQGATAPAQLEAVQGWAHTQDVSQFSNLYEACNVFYRTDALRRAGGFDDQLGYFGEDTAAGWAVLRLGFRAAFAKTALVYHDVTSGGFSWYLRRTRNYRNWPRIVRHFPEMRDSLLWRRIFLRPRSAWFTFAVLGVVLAGRWRPALVLSLPYMWVRAPRSLHPSALRTSVELVVFDASVFAAMVEGSIRAGTLVL